ncbi:MAG: DUF2520 domain-containing protein [Flavobacterium sp.]|nr:DUF2520 domain-containing protein [Candidatus Neoflavobacterium equi]
MIKVNLIGAGNVAQHLIQVFQKNPFFEIQKIYCRKPFILEELISLDKVTSNIAELTPADVTILAVSDQSISELSSKIPFENQLVVHTSGSCAMDVLDPKNRRGVFYPLQTFSKNKPLNFSEIPLCIESEGMNDLVTLKKMALQLTEKIYNINSQQRQALHVSAVFVSNFVNHMYVLGNEICQENKIPFEIFHPLIAETAAKIQSISPREAQTGPAKRQDMETLNKHMDFLNQSDKKEIYKLITQSILNKNVKEL